MIDDGSYKMRRNPRNPKFFEYLNVCDSSEQKVKRSQTMGTQGSSKLRKEEFAALRESISSNKLTDQMLSGLETYGLSEVEACKATLAYEDADDEDADDDESRMLYQHAYNI